MPLLDWLNKQDAVRSVQKVPYRLLQAVPELAAGDTDSQNADRRWQSGSVKSLVAVVCGAGQLKYETQKLIDPHLQRSLLFFDLWVENEDRTLTDKGGNLNLLWSSDESALYVIDHNLIFDDALNKAIFWSAHVFKDVLCIKQGDAVEAMALETRMKNSLACWQTAWDNMPETWAEYNHELACFEPEKHLQRLTDEANGTIWLKLPWSSKSANTV